jgi:amino-acid N-acetyltransferase
VQFSTKSNNLKHKDNESGALRYAKVTDIEEIGKLLEPYAKKGIMLYKDPAKIEQDLPRTLVYCIQNKITGIANLHKYDLNLYEIRGLAVLEHYQNQGIGKKIIDKLVADLKDEYPDLKIKIFALTLATVFFQKLGFKKVSKENFPRKIFDDCSYCLKRDDCFEDAVEKEI